MMGRLALVIGVFLIGCYAVLSCYGNAVALPDTPFITTRGDAAVSLLELRQLAAADLQAQAGGRMRGGGEPVRRRTAAAQLLGQEPLSADALVLANGNPTSNAKRATARPLITEALRRDPRSRGARAWQIVDAALSRRFPEAMHNFERLLSIAPADSQVAVPLIALLINDPEARQTLLENLRQPRSWHAQLAGEIARSRLPTQVVEQFAAILIRHPDPGTRQEILGALISRGAYDRAYALWTGQLPTADRPARPQVNAPDFTDFPGGHPFAWTMSQDGGDGAVPLDGGGIEVRFSGQRAMTLVSQMLVMPPGRYILVVDGGDRPIRGAGLTWTVRCAGTAAVLGTLDLAALSAEQKHASAQIVIPTTCRAQHLSLIGQAALFPSETLIEIQSVNLLWR
ncbi:MAG: hypothetical protein ABL882_00400 [Sphingopyxis sp.]